MKIQGQIERVAIDDTGRVTIFVRAGDDQVECSIPPERAIDSLMPLLLGIARASEKPGPAYRMMINPVQIALERVAVAGSDPVPCLDLGLDNKTFLRIALARQRLKQLAEALLALDREMTKPGLAH